nr:hypothetical protein [Tanacetum cinerariifolium]
TCSDLARRVEGLEHDKAAQQLEIVKLKARVKRLEKINMVKSSKLRWLKKVGTSQRVEFSDDMENVFNQGRIVADMDMNKRIKRKGVVIRDPEEELPSDTPAGTSKVKDKGKGILIEALKTMKKKDQIDMDAEFLFKSKEEMEEEYEEIIKSINETPAQKVAKRRKRHEQAKEDEDLKKQLEVVDDEDDDVFIEATP